MITLCRNLPFPVTTFRTHVIVLLLLFILVSAQDCDKINSCRCRFHNGSVIDLEKLALHEKPRWASYESKDNKTDYTYSYNPCFDFKLPESLEPSTTSECSDGVAGCQVSKSVPTQYFSLGKQGSSRFEWDKQTQTLRLIYTSKMNRILTVVLNCKPDPIYNSTLEVVEENPTLHYYMILTSRCACPDLCAEPEGGLSGGSVFVILFSVFVVLYLLFGMIFNKIARGAQGWELLPNYEFWRDFPLLVRDGCVYVANGCKSDTVYERI